MGALEMRDQQQRQLFSCPWRVLVSCNRRVDVAMQGDVQSVTAPSSLRAAAVRCTYQPANRALGFGLVAWRVHCNCGRAGGPSQSGGAGGLQMEACARGSRARRGQDGRRTTATAAERRGCKDGKKRRKIRKMPSCRGLPSLSRHRKSGGGKTGSAGPSGLVWSAAYKARPTLVTWSQRADAARAQDEPACAAYRVAQTAACGAYLAGPPTSLHAVCPVVHWSPL